MSPLNAWIWAGRQGCFALLSLAVTHPAAPTDRSGAEIFATVCSMCHVEETPRMKAPSIEALRRLTSDNIKDALTLGVMMDIGNSLSDKEIDNIAAFLTAPSGKTPQPDKAG